MYCKYKNILIKVSSNYTFIKIKVSLRLKNATTIVTCMDGAERRTAPKVVSMRKNSLRKISHYHCLTRTLQKMYLCRGIRTKRF